MKKTKIYRREWIIILLALIMGLVLGWFFFGGSGSKIESHQHEEEMVSKETIWTCSMHPQIRRNEPGQCPICGMDLVPINSTQSEDEYVGINEIQMTESAMKLADIQTGIVEIGVPEKTIHLLGKVKPDERNIATITSRFGGRIESLFVNYTGQMVRKGEKLATIYSPELISAQKELLESLKFEDLNASLYKAAKNKLRLWNLTNEQIEAIESRGEPELYFEIQSPIGGTITKRNVATGDYVKEGSALFEIINLSKVWVMFDAYESDLPWINVGDKVEFTINSLPGNKFSGNVVYIDPIIDAKTRVARVRVELANPGYKLKPEMFANGILKAKISKGEGEFLIPKSAILWTGKRSVVYVKVPDRKTPSFIYKEIILGPEAGNNYVVIEGLEEGDEIAINGVFKIDASAQLAGLPSMMNPKGSNASIGHNHGDKGNQKMNEQTSHTIKSYRVDKSFKVQLTGYFEEYLNLVEAFVNSNVHEVQVSSKAVLEKLDHINMSLLKGDAHMVWMKFQEKMKESLNSIAILTDIEQQRSEFARFNLELYKSLKTFGLDGIIAYYQYCPMAERDKGAYWLSNSKEIRNPYFGKAMLTCGENRETIK